MKHLFFCLILLSSQLSVGAEYLSEQDFISQSFTNSPTMKSIWLKGERQEVAKEMLGHRYPALRLRYWMNGTKSAWIMNEVGKEKPITIGVTIEGDKIERVSILAYRESRGGEIRHPFFTEQFVGAGLKPNADLGNPVDGIAGATLSVRAVTNISRFALYLSESTASEFAIGQVSQ